MGTAFWGVGRWRGGWAGLGWVFYIMGLHCRCQVTYGSTYGVRSTLLYQSTWLGCFFALLARVMQSEMCMWKTKPPKVGGGGLIGDLQVGPGRRGHQVKQAARGSWSSMMACLGHVCMCGGLCFRTFESESYLPLFPVFFLLLPLTDFFSFLLQTADRARSDILH